MFCFPGKDQAHTLARHNYAMLVRALEVPLPIKDAIVLSYWVIQLDANEVITGNVAAVQVTNVADKTGPLPIHQDPVPGLQRRLLLFAGLPKGGAAHSVGADLHLLAVGAVARVDAAPQGWHLGTVLKVQEWRD